jgi:hypothetical protein
LKFLKRDSDLLPLTLGQLLEDLGIDDLSRTRRGQRQAQRCSNQGDVPVGGSPSQILERLVAPDAGLFVNLLQALPVFVCLECGGDGGTQLVDEPRDVVTELRSHAFRQRDRPWTVRLVEVVNVTPVARGRLGRRLFLEEPPDDRMLSGARRAEREDVIAVAPHADAELNRRYGPFLPEYQRTVR